MAIYKINIRHGETKRHPPSSSNANVGTKQKI